MNPKKRVQKSFLASSHSNFQRVSLVQFLFFMNQIQVSKLFSSTHLPPIPVYYQHALHVRWLDAVPKLLSNSVSAAAIKTHCLHPLPFSTAARAWLVITRKPHRSQSPPPLHHPSPPPPPPTHRWLLNVLPYIMAQAWDGAITRPFLSIEAVARLLLALAEQSHSAAAWCLPHAMLGGRRLAVTVALMAECAQKRDEVTSSRIWVQSCRLAEGDTPVQGWNVPSLLWYFNHTTPKTVGS